MNDEEVDTMIAQFMDQGFIEPVFNEDGSVTVRIVASPDNPLWNLHLEDINEDINSLLEKGMIEITGMNEDGELCYAPTEYGKKLMEES